ncbi:MAG: ATP phosphoribosyltransferase [Enterococcus sp.]
MNQSITVLRPEEQIAIKLREKYHQSDFQLFRLSSFEEYDLYLQNKAFLTNSDPITFTGNDGRLMALNPDVTLSIVKNTPAGKTRRVYYNEDVYRHDRKNGEYRRINQIGLEMIGALSETSELEVIRLAMESLLIAGGGSLDISHIALAQDLKEIFIDEEQRKIALLAMQTKSQHNMQAVCQKAQLSEELKKQLLELTILTGEIPLVIDVIQQLHPQFKYTLATIPELTAIASYLTAYPTLAEKVKLRVDFSIVNDTDYYSGILFQGFLEGIPDAVLFGGRYDNLLKRQNQSHGAIGFGMYLDGIDRVYDTSKEDSDYLNVALPKGRMGQVVYELLVKAKLVKVGLFDDSRKLIFEDTENKIRFFLVKPSDVDVYVEKGAADIGVVGRDVLLESGAEILELLDLGIGKCKMSVAGHPNFEANPSRPLRVATKYTNIARTYYSQIRQSMELIQLHGSIELAPLLDLSDVIVDIVETGTTLKENNLVVLEDILESSARLVANPAAWRFKQASISNLMTKVSDVL